ncbi:MAG: transcriptional repressor NrdR [Ruminococcaceae bacterium]|nr:transcriptional repressor NrdR [Oscillospiraceae bacterium]
MRCPYCGHDDSKVIDSRPTEEGVAIRRRRECIKCTQRFTTYEKVESLPIVVIKKDKTRELFNREKLLAGLTRACEKRPVETSTLDRLVDKIESDLQNTLKREVSTKEIGEKVMEGLKDIDEVAYVRFASVYRQFKDVTTFIAEVNKLLVDKN